MQQVGARNVICDLRLIPDTQTGEVEAGNIVKITKNVCYVFSLNFLMNQRFSQVFSSNDAVLEVRLNRRI